LVEILPREQAMYRQAARVSITGQLLYKR